MKPKAGEAFDVPRGAPIHSTKTGDWTPAKRKQTVWPTSVMVVGNWTMVTWPGQGGYWRRVVLLADEFVDRWPS